MANDREQYERIQHALLGFRSGAMNLNDLLEAVPSILKDVESPDPAWKDEFVSYWWTLEQVHEDAIELGESRRMPAGSRVTVDAALEGLDRLVREALVSA